MKAWVAQSLSKSEAHLKAREYLQRDGAKIPVIRFSALRKKKIPKYDLFKGATSLERCYGVLSPCETFSNR